MPPRSWTSPLFVLVLVGVVLGPTARPAASEDRLLEIDGPFVGIEGANPYDPRHVDPVRLRLFAGLGPVMVRTASVAWGTIEPHPPVLDGRHLRDWEALDLFVRRWEEAGYDVVPTLSPASPWAGSKADVATARMRDELRDQVEGEADVPRASREIAGPVPKGATAPRAEAWKDWETFVAALVERYDADGLDDAPGATRPLRWIQLLDRPGDPDRWLGTMDAYLRLAHHAHVGADTAAAPTRLVHGGVSLAALGHEAEGREPSEEEVRQRARRRVRGMPWEARAHQLRALAFDRESAALRGLFGAIPARGNLHPADDITDFMHLGRRLRDERVEGTEIWLEASPAERVGEALTPRAASPGAAELQRRARWMAAARRPGHAERQMAVAWRDRGRAYDVVRTICRARAAGAARVFVAGRVRREDPLDVFVSGSPKDGWRRRPAWYALHQLLARLGKHTDVDGRSLGRRAEAFTFRMAAGAKRPWVKVVFQKPEGTWAGDPAGTLTPLPVHLPLEDGTYVVEEVRLGEAEPGVRRVKVDGGVLGLQLGAAPVYLYPAGGS